MSVWRHTHTRLTLLSPVLEQYTEKPPSPADPDESVRHPDVTFPCPSKACIHGVREPRRSAGIPAVTYSSRMKRVFHRHPTRKPMEDGSALRTSSRLCNCPRTHTSQLCDNNSVIWPVIGCSHGDPHSTPLPVTGLFVRYDVGPPH